MYATGSVSCTVEGEMKPTNFSVGNMREFGRTIRRDVLVMCERTFSGHVGSAFAVADVLAVLYSGVVRGRHPELERDRVILSKGHACAAQYSALYRTGVMPERVFSAFSQDGSPLGHHPHYEPAIGLEANTGSLGHGLSIGAGLAYSAWKQGSPARVFILQSDGETNEGSVWEAAMFAAHHRLNNLCMILDANGMQALGNTRDILLPTDHAIRWQAFGWEVVDVDGHDHAALWSALSSTGQTQRPTAIIARTVMGKGVSFMEQQLLWHYRQPKGAEFQAALRELDAQALSSPGASRDE